MTARLCRERVCSGCPFTRGPAAVPPESLTDARREEIARVLMADQTFVCHKETRSQCAGAAVILDRMGRPNQVMRFSERLGEPLTVDPGRELIPWETLEEWVDVEGWEEGR